MSQPIKLALIPDDQYSGYRYNVIFKAYKWDPQVGDHNTVSKHVVLMERETAEQLAEWAEKLSEETVMMEEAFTKKLSLAEELGLPKPINRALRRLPGYERERHVRLMRFDFHPTTSGWAVSEVNSDAPGGFAEASVLPEIVGKYFEGYVPGNSAAESLLQAFEPRIKKGGAVAFVHATSYSDDRQVMQFLSDYFTGRGYNTIFAAPDHLKWVDKKAVSIVEGQEGEVDGIVRFFPLEWLAGLPKKSNWMGYYDCETPSCNHPIAMFAQSKRLPLVWDKLGVDIPAWKMLLPETRDPRLIKRNDADWIYKPALGRVGEGITIKQAMPDKEISRIKKAANRQPKDWLAQKMFESRAIMAEDDKSYHLCVGVFTVNGKFAGFYGRISPYPRIDANAEDIPVLVGVQREGNDNER